ncbi:MAG TPA: HAD family hydrolase [Alphaproteobacteria bacterium]|nr:HAD family hydrolase [Alphaproteobacteria bacterium]
MALTFPKAIIFDWDNTLVDSWPAIMDAINQTRKHYGLETWSLPEIKKNCTRAARDSFPEWFGEEWEVAYAYYYNAFDKVRKQYGIVTMPGATELLKYLNEKEVPCFIVSNKRGDYLRIEIAQLKWKDYFTGVAGAHDAPKDKPAREHVVHALTGSGHEPHPDIWFVGDSEADVACARNANCTPALIGTPEDAQKLGVELVFPDCQALETLLKSLQQK